MIHITDRHGDSLDDINLSSPSPVLSLEWDRDGEYLAILQEGSGVVPLWSLSSRRVVPLETNLKDPTFIAWSRSGPQLAVGTEKGSVLIYNKSRKQKIPVVGKHSKRITCGAWSEGGNKLVLGANDRTITVSNESGDTLLHTELKYNPSEISFTTSRGAREEDLVSANLGGKSLLLYNILDEKEDPMELTFAPRENGGGCRYGELLHHHWYDDSLALVGFSGGYLVAVSTGAKTLGEEKFAVKFHSQFMSSFAYNPLLKRAATAGDDGIHIVDVRDFKEIKADFISNADLENGKISSLCWSPDGQILTVGTTAGNVYSFLAKMSVLFAVNKQNVCYLSSLREVSVLDAVKRSRAVDVTVKLEPAFIALGPRHIAAGMNNHVYYHRIGGSGPAGAPVSDQEYVGVVKEVQINGDYAAILTDSKAQIHPIEPQDGPVKSKTFPSREEGSYARVTCIALTDDFLFYGTEAGTVEVFFLTEWTLLSGVELRLDNPIRKIYPNANGTRVVIVDAANQCFLFNPVTGGGVNQSITRFESAPTNVANVLWDLQEKNVIIFYDGAGSVHTYIYVPTSMKGAMLVKLGPVSVSAEGGISMIPDVIDIADGQVPILSSNGCITCQTPTGNLTTIMHPFFDSLGEPISADGRSRKSEEGRKDKKYLANKFCQALALNKLDQAWEIALQIDRSQFLLALSARAVELLAVQLAILVYNRLGDAGMVMALTNCLAIEDKALLGGQIALLSCNYPLAQDLFLSSSRPSAALEMRKNLRQWDAALKLAKVINLYDVPDICLQYGLQLELRDEKEAALRMFEDALGALDHDGNPICPDAIIAPAKMGIARSQLRVGNLRQGIRMANEMDEQKLFEDCGAILEDQKQYGEAAGMFVKAQQFEKAALIYTKYLIKNDKSRISEAAVILEKVDNDALNAAFAKACLTAGRYDDALKAFRRAHDNDKVVEILLRNLDQVQAAFDLVRSGASAAAAQLVADYCNEQADHRGAIEFLLMANKSDDAFKLAQANNIMDVYCLFLGSNVSSEDALKVAHYYEKNQDFGRAGKFYSLCGQYQRALRLFLQCGDREIDAAIEVVGKSQNETLTHQLIDFLVGEKDGMPKDPNYIYRLYLALKKFDEAAKTALVIARQEQDLGNFPAAHAVLVETIRQLEDKDMKVPLLMRQSFVLLHSYELIKGLVRAKDHLAAARLLLRVASNVSKFPSRVVQILTATVIECSQAGLKASAYEYAVVLVRPEYRASLDPNLKRRIEQVVRRRVTAAEELPEELTPCPLSNQMIPAMALECPSTKDALPMCVVSGRHIVLDDCCFCPVSRFPALHSEYVRYIQNCNADPETSDTPPSSFRRNLSAPDPVTGKSVSVADLVKATPEEVLAYIKKYNNVFDKEEEEEAAAAEGAEDGTTEEEAAATVTASAKGKSSKKAGAIPPSKHAKAARAKMERMQRSKKGKSKGGGEGAADKQAKQG